MEEAKDSSNPSTLKQSTVRKQKILPQSMPNKEAENSSLMSPIQNQISVRKQKILPQSSPRITKEAEDSSLVDHISTLLLSELFIPKQVVRGRRFFPMHIHSSASFSPSLVDPTCGHIIRESNMQAR